MLRPSLSQLAAFDQISVAVRVGWADISRSDRFAGAVSIRVQQVQMPGGLGSSQGKDGKDSRALHQRATIFLYLV